MKNLFNLKRVSIVKANQEAVLAAGTLVAANVDTLNFRNAIFYVDIVATGAVGYTISLEQCETSGGSYTAVPSAKFESIVGAIEDEAGTEIFEVAVSGLQRFVKAKVVTTGAGTSTMAVIYTLGDQNYTPTATKFLEK